MHLRFFVVGLYTTNSCIGGGQTLRGQACSTCIQPWTGGRVFSCGQLAEPEEVLGNMCMYVCVCVHV